MDPLQAFQITAAAALLVALLLLHSVVFATGKRSLRSNGRSKKRQQQLPPGPRPWPVVGNLFQVGAFPHKSMMNFTKQYGPLVYLQLGAVPTVVTDSPAIVKEILMKQDHVFASRPENIACQYFTYNGKDIAFAPYGPHWRAMRKICTVELLAPRKLACFSQGRSEELQCFVGSVLEDSRRGKMINLRDKFASLSINNLTRMLLGKRFFGPGDAGPEDAAEHKNMIYEGFALVNAFNVADYLPFLRWMDLQGHERKMRAIMKRTDEVYDLILEEHKQRLKQQGAAAAAAAKQSFSSDFVDVLLSVPGENGEKHLGDTIIKAIIIDMISAGTDTSSVTSEWAMAELIRHPEALRKVREEIDSVVGKERVVEESDLVHFPYLKAVVKEIFRLHPVGAFLIPHFSTEDAKVAGYDIPRNTRILVNNYSLGRNESVWGDPLVFRPERFAQEDQQVELMDPECRIVPFGAGRRSCPGASLGGCMVLMGLARLIHSFDWFPPPGMEAKDIDVTERVGFTVLEKSLELMAKPRLHASLYEEKSTS